MTTRRVVAVVIGVLAANLMILGFETIGAILFSNPGAASEAAFLAMPLGGQGVVVLGWVGGTLFGALVALRVAQWRPGGWIVALAIIASGIRNLTQLPYPFWMQVATIAAPLAGGWLAQRWFHRARPGDALLG